jgi:hypothetical protein
MPKRFTVAAVTISTTRFTGADWRDHFNDTRTDDEIAAALEDPEMLRLIHESPLFGTKNEVTEIEHDIRDY